MMEQAILLNTLAQNLTESTASQLRKEYQAYQRLFMMQPAPVKQYINDQAVALADAIINNTTPVHFSLPDHVNCLPMMDCKGMEEKIPTSDREHKVGSLIDGFTRPNLSLILSRRLSELERSSNQATSVAAGLIRYAVVVVMINQRVPEGQSVVYARTDEDDIPNQPEVAIIANERGVEEPRDSKVEEKYTDENKTSKLSYAHGFFLPQLVAFDHQNRLFAASLELGISFIDALRRYLFILYMAVELAPYMVVDQAYQDKRYGILGQLVNQGRSLASHQVDLICQTIKERSAMHRLDRGFSLSLPYFNDKSTEIEHYNFDVIPKGRVMFVPAFVVLAVREEAKKILQNTNLSLATRKTLLQELSILERVFIG